MRPILCALVPTAAFVPLQTAPPGAKCTYSHSKHSQSLLTRSQLPVPCYPQPHLETLRKYTYGKHIVNKVEALLAAQAQAEAASAAAGAGAAAEAAAAMPMPAAPMPMPVAVAAEQ